MKKRAAGILTLILVASLLGASDVRGGAALVPAGKTTGPALTATIVMDVTGPASVTSGKGLTAIMVENAQSSAAVLFVSSGYVSMWSIPGCLKTETGFDPQGYANLRFAGFLMNGWVAPQPVLFALLQQFGDPNKAAITTIDHAACTLFNRNDGTGPREILSFAAVIEFQP